MLCLNPKCRVRLHDYQWGEGYCSAECMSDCLDRGQTLDGSLHRPDAWRELQITADEVDAMLEAMAIDERLPRIIFLRRKRKTYRQIAKVLNTDGKSCHRILMRATPNLLFRCGLRK